MPKRKDATFIGNLDPFHSIVPYVMPKRTESEVSITENFDITELNKFISRYNEEADSKLKLFHCVCYAVARTIYHRPKMNIFIAGRRYWQRKKITLSFVAKQKFEDQAEEILMCMECKPEMNITDVSQIINGDVKKARSEGKNDLTGTMDFVGKLPRPILTFLFWILSRLEYHGIMPDSLTKGDPNYSSVLLSNLGSIGAGAPYHHLSNYGTCSIMATIGTAYTDPQTKREYLPTTIILDERIADGFYFVKSLKLIHHIFKNPDLLLEEIERDIDFDVDAKPVKKETKSTKKTTKTTKKVEKATKKTTKATKKTSK